MQEPKWARSGTGGQASPRGNWLAAGWPINKARCSEEGLKVKAGRCTWRGGRARHRPLPRHLQNFLHNALDHRHHRTVHSVIATRTPEPQPSRHLFDPRSRLLCTVRRPNAREKGATLVFEASRIQGAGVYVIPADTLCEQQPQLSKSLVQHPASSSPAGYLSLAAFYCLGTSSLCLHSVSLLPWRARRHRRSATTAPRALDLSPSLRVSPHCRAHPSI
jgi:hypothetical protein